MVARLIEAAEIRLLLTPQVLAESIVIDLPQDSVTPLSANTGLTDTMIQEVIELVAESISPDPQSAASEAAGSHRPADLLDSINVGLPLPATARRPLPPHPEFPSFVPDLLDGQPVGSPEIISLPNQVTEIVAEFKVAPNELEVVSIFIVRSDSGFNGVFREAAVTHLSGPARHELDEPSHQMLLNSVELPDTVQPATSVMASTSLPPTAPHDSDGFIEIPSGTSSTASSGLKSVVDRTRVAALTKLTRKVPVLDDHGSIAARDSNAVTPEEKHLSGDKPSRSAEQQSEASRPDGFIELAFADVEDAEASLPSLDRYTRTIRSSELESLIGRFVAFDSVDGVWTSPVSNHVEVSPVAEELSTVSRLRERVSATGLWAIAGVASVLIGLRFRFTQQSQTEKTVASESARRDVSG
ncbi:hypothetical protein GC176_23980 [bacterium]|nr:hypothetical protein [bacterium]